MKNSGRFAGGFTLVEAMVALVILSASGLAVFAWINSSLASLRRVEEANARSQALTNIVEHMQSVNPMLQPEGRMDFGTYTIDWRAEQAEPVIDGSGYPRGISLYQLALYKTRVAASRTGDPHWFELDLNLVGYKRVRSAQSPL